MTDSGTEIERFAATVLASVREVGRRHEYSVEDARLDGTSLVLEISPANSTTQRYAVHEPLEEAHRAGVAPARFVHELRGGLRDFFGQRWHERATLYEPVGEVMWLTPPPGRLPRVARPGRVAYAEVVADVRRRMHHPPELIAEVERTVAPMAADLAPTDAYTVRSARTVGTFPHTQVVLTLTAPRFPEQRFGWAFWLWQPSRHARTSAHQILSDADITIRERFAKLDAGDVAGFDHVGDVAWIVRPGDVPPW